MTVDTTRQSEWLDFFAYNPASRHRQRLILKLLSSVSFRSVLDIGCGDGSLLFTLRDRFGCAISGLDRRSDAVALSRGHLEHYYDMDICREQPQGSFDLVTCTEVLEHLTDDRAALRHIAQICAGHVLLTVPGGAVRETDRRMGHLRHYTPSALLDLVTGCGLHPVKSVAWGFPFHSAYKWTQDLAPGAMMRGFGRARYGPGQKALCQLLHGLFYLNSSRTGQQLLMLASSTVP